jgi:hypothetical protein
MFEMSVNEVPGWSVTIVPMLIGVPVAATPGWVPQLEASTVVEPLLADAEEAAALLAAGALDDVPVLALELELEVELELHAARTPSDRAATTVAAVRILQWTGLFMGSAFWLTASD